MRSKVHESEYRSYPPRSNVGADERWAAVCPEYAPPELTLPFVYELNEDPFMCDPYRVERRLRIFNPGATAPRFQKDGRPLNPFGRTGLTGRGVLPKWGFNVFAYALVLRPSPADKSHTQALVVERSDAPGVYGMPEVYDSGDSFDQNVVLESLKETLSDYVVDDDVESLKLLHKTPMVNDPRNTDNSWVEGALFVMKSTTEKQETSEGSHWHDIEAFADDDEVLFADHHHVIREANQRH